jgi:DNA repair protein RecO (recombination protein O)
VLQKTKGIVFRFTKYGEASIIVNIFTAQFGMQSYIVNGVRAKSTKSKIALYQPLTLLDLVVYHKEHANLLRIKEIKCAYPYKMIYSDVRKSTLAMFIAEILNKAVRDEGHTEEVCDFLFEALMALDQQENFVENFHLIFLLKLSRYLGFGPQYVNEVVGGRYATPEMEAVLALLLKASFDTPVQMSNVLRREVLTLLITFYADHLDSLGEIKSLPVLRELMR